MSDPPSRLLVNVVDGRGRAVRVPGLARWLVAVAPRAARGEVTIALVSDAHIRRLNRDYRHKDAATDVLSFRMADRDGVSEAARVPRGGSDPATREPYLGDIVIARGAAGRQAREAGHTLGTEVRVLALHGLLHLVGYDHERDRGEMKRLEARLLRRGGVRAGLIDRSS